MDYIYFVENQGIEDVRDNSDVIKLAYDLEVPEEFLYIEEGIDDREQLCSLFKSIGEGDRLIVPNVKELANNLKELLLRFQQLNEIGVVLCSIEEPVFSGEDYLEVLETFKGLYRYYISLQKRQGYIQAVEERRVGRPQVDKDKLEQAIRMYKTKAFKIEEIEKLTGISKSTLYRECDKRKSVKN